MLLLYVEAVAKIKSSIDPRLVCACSASLEFKGKPKKLKHFFFSASFFSQFESISSSNFIFDTREMIHSLNCAEKKEEEN